MMLLSKYCTENDIQFIVAVYRSTREEELKLTNWTEEQKSAFIYMQSMAQLAEYKGSPQYFGD